MTDVTELDQQAATLLPLSPAVLHILLAVADVPRHGLGIVAEVEERTGGRVTLGPGTLYGTLKRMLQSGLLVESEERPEPAHDDPRRRYYEVTELGRRAAELEAHRLEQLLRIARDKKVLRRAGRVRRRAT